MIQIYKKQNNSRSPYREPVVNRQKDLPNWAELAVCVKGLYELF